MTRCLREYTLVMLYIGEGTHEEQTHIASCDHCSQRYQHLARDWQRIGNILHTAPLPRTEGRFSSPFTQIWAPLATALAVMLLLVFASIQLWQPHTPRMTQTISKEESVSFVETAVVPALFANEPLSTLAPPTPVSDETYVQAALDDGWPCEEDESTLAVNCGTHTFALLIGE